MIAVNYSTLRENLKKYCDQAIADSETIIITRKRESNVVLLSLKEYNNMVENLEIMSNRKYYERLLQAKEQIESGKGQVHDLIEEKE